MGDTDFAVIDYLKQEGYAGAMFWAVNEAASVQNPDTPKSSAHAWQGSTGANAQYIAKKAATPSSNPSPGPTSYKTITPSSNPGLCFDLPGGEALAGTKLWLWECNGSQNQQWAFDNWQIRYGADQSMCVDAGDMKDGNQLFLWNCNGLSQQSWGLDSSASRIYLKNTRACMDFDSESKKSGTIVQVWNCNGQENQWWNVKNSLATILV